MITTRNQLRHCLREDARVNSISPNYLKYLLQIICGSEKANIFHWIKPWRKAEYHFNNRRNPYHMLMYGIYRAIYMRRSLRTGIYAPLNRIGYGLKIMHLGGGTYLNAKKIGNYCSFNTGVLLGNNGSEESCPLLHDHVWFGPGAKAYGDITIESNTFVAANAVVTK